MMPRLLRTVPALALLLTMMLSATAMADLTARIDRAVRGASLEGASVGISVRDSATNAEIVSLNSKAAMVPASNMKLLTTGAALHILGGDFIFQTKLLSDGQRLIVRGDGDPAFGDPDLLSITQIDDRIGLDVEDFLQLWIKPVQRSGIDSFKEIVVDDRIFDREFVHDTWPIDQLNRRYCAEVAGLNFHLNVLHVYPRPVEGRRPSIASFEPRYTGLDISNQATSNRKSDDNNTAWIARRLNTNRMTLYGNVKFEYRVPVPVTLHNVPEMFGSILRDRLRENGVAVDRVRLAGEHEQGLDGELIAPIISTPISTIIERCNRDSQNMYAESLLKRCGAKMTGQSGTWTNGSAVLRHAILDRLGTPSLVAGVVVADGSGLSRDNRVAPHTLTAWLNSFHNDSQLSDIFIASLAEPGGPGTLRNRFRNTNLYSAKVQAKSGYIREVSCLSGFVTMPDGRRRAFSIMVNDLSNATRVRRARQLQEEVVALIARDMAT
ncbi:MAG: D-alanyl-D-alanine carboxypeptidase/D-alanyl-D-alanine-endopeptidase, partial [Phycisphaerales bacterium]